MYTQSSEITNLPSILSHHMTCLRSNHDDDRASRASSSNSNHSIIPSIDPKVNCYGYRLRTSAANQTFFSFHAFPSQLEPLHTISPSSPNTYHSSMSLIPILSHSHYRFPSLPLPSTHSNPLIPKQLIPSPPL